MDLAKQLNLDYGQDELARLCPDRALETHEIHDPNDYYGQASVLKRYAGLDDDYALRAVLEHGVIVDERIWDYDRDQRLAWILAASKPRAKQLDRLSGKHSEPIGFGFLYARALELQRKPQADGQARQGTIIFPCHSTHTVTSRYDHEDYATRIVNLPDELQPAAVCLYWRNYEMGNHLCYQEKGIPVFTAGHMYDRDFMLRFFDLCRNFRFAASNVIGTHFFQAVASGCHYFELPSGAIETEVPDLKKEGESRGTPLGEYHEAIESSSLCDWRSIDISHQQQIVDDVLGVGSFQTPEELRKTLQRAERADLTHATRVWNGNNFALAPPAYFRRRMRFVQRIRKSINKRLPWKNKAA